VDPPVYEPDEDRVDPVEELSHTRMTPSCGILRQP
jgi:hypothetical protein